MSRTIGAIIIYLDQDYTPREDVGLYTPVGGDSEIRWSEAPLDGFCESMLLKNGIGAITESFDDTNGGNSSIVGDFSFSVHGAAQFLLKMKSLSIQLSGKTVEYVEYVGEEGAYTAETVGTFTIEDMTSNEFEERFTAKTAFSYARNALLGTRVSESEFPDADEAYLGKTIPVTFGESDPANGIFFEVPRIEYRNRLMPTSEIIPLLSGRPAGMTLFPVRDPADSADHIEVIFGSGIGPAYTLTQLLGKYVKIVEGSVAADGEIRRISASPSTQADGDFRVDKWVDITLAQFFSEIAPGLSGGDYHTWVNIIEALLRYALDYSVCSGFPEGLPDFYVRESDRMIRVVDVGVVPDDTLPVYDVEPPKSFEEIGSTSSFKVLPVAGIDPLIARDYDNVVINDIDRFGITGCIHAEDSSSDPVPGVFIALGSGNLCADGMVVTAEEDGYDRTSTTRAEFNAYMTTAAPVDYFNYYIVLKITLPTIDDTVVFDNVYLGINAASICDNDSTDPTLQFSSRFIIAKRRYYGDSENPVDTTTLDFDDQVYFRSLPDDYYTDSYDSKNQWFYYAEESAHLFSGYKNYDLNISSKEEYDNIEELVLIFKREGLQNGIASYIDDQINIAEMGIIFEKTITIGSELYA